jgi:hypothetical protein
VVPDFHPKAKALLPGFPPVDEWLGFPSRKRSGPPLQSAGPGLPSTVSTRRLRLSSPDRILSQRPRPQSMSESRLSTGLTIGPERVPGLASRPDSTSVPSRSTSDSVHVPNAELHIAAEPERLLRQPLNHDPCDDCLRRPVSLPGQTEDASLDSPRYMPRLDRSVRRLACLSSAPSSPIDPGANRIRRVASRTWSVFRGLSYVGIRASSRQVLPRRLEPILSWVFTSLGFSPFLP